MSRRRKWAWTAGILAVAVAGATVALRVVGDPLALPGEHRVEVYGLNDAISGETQDEPNVFGMCDADTYFARDGDRKLCLVLNGPLGEVEATREDGTVTVAAADVARLRQMAGQETGSPDPTTTLVLMAGGPAALIPVAGLGDGRPVSVRALS
ncbi:hypothetical protein [Actinoplanes sp. URMC 104]|uniref:hypothetical protein n=1 Tax=Actinoplanes sp. URMC 104 TaxID=3423409 RepID=UPI003F1C1A31